MDNGNASIWIFLTTSRLLCRVVETTHKTPTAPIRGETAFPSVCPLRQGESVRSVPIPRRVRSKPFRSHPFLHRVSPLRSYEIGSVPVLRLFRSFPFRSYARSVASRPVPPSLFAPGRACGAASVAIASAAAAARKPHGTALVRTVTLDMPLLPGRGAVPLPPPRPHPPSQTSMRTDTIRPLWEGVLEAKVVKR